VFLAGDFFDGELGAVDQGKEDVESSGAFAGIVGSHGAIRLVVCKVGSASSEIRPAFEGERGPVERHGAGGRRVVEFEKDILDLISEGS
jgi:hypothetical protein